MSKLALVAAVITALVAVTVVADGEAAESLSPFRSTQTQCQREVEESALDACQQVMHNVVYKVPGQLLRWSPGLHVRCCQQLLGVRRECRHAAIRGLVKEYEVPLEEGSGETVEYGQAAHRPQQEQQGQGFQGESTEQEQQEDSIFRPLKPHRRHRVEGHELGETARQQEGQGYGLPSAPGFSTEQQAALLRLMKARQFAARLPATCRFETARGRDASSAGMQY
ncbi:unnamed protein product [Alopecurus aequalis]